MQTTIHQHFVPRMYLKRWVHDSANSKMLYVIAPKLGDFDVHEKSYDDELFYEDYCYDVVSNEGELFTKNYVEHKLDSYEKRHDRLIKRIIKRCEQKMPVLDKGVNRLSDFMEFFGLMTVRNPYNNMPLPTAPDVNIRTAQDMADYLNNLTDSVFNLTPTKILALANNKELLFQMANQFKFFPFTIDDVYFLETPLGASFITGDNPIVLSQGAYYVPLSPKYAAYLLLDKSHRPSFAANVAHGITEDYVNRFNNQYKSKDVYTLIGNDKKILIDTLNF